MRYPLVLLVLTALLGGIVPCQAQNLLPNPEFDQDVTGWPPPQYYTTALSWDPHHSAFGPGGSALLSLPYGASLQTSACVPVTPGISYAWGGQFMFPVSVQGQSFQLSLGWTSDTSCANPIGGLYLSAGDSPVGQWRTLSGQGTAPAGAKSALFVVQLSANLDSEAHAMNFDDVFLGPAGTVGPGQADEIPALSPLGLVALALGLGLAALQRLSRAWDEKV